MTIDPEYYEQVSLAAISAMDDFAQKAPMLAAREVEERSPDGRIIVRVTAGGKVTAITLRNGVLRRYDSVALGEMIAQTLGAAQRKARAEFESAMLAAIPDEVEEANRLIRESARDMP